MRFCEINIVRPDLYGTPCNGFAILFKMLSAHYDILVFGCKNRQRPLLKKMLKACRFPMAQSPGKFLNGPWMSPGWTQGSARLSLQFLINI